MRRLALFLAALASVPMARADEPTEAALRLDLARVLVGEADGSRDDWAALLWTLRHRQQRAGRRPLQGFTRYSTVFQGRNRRAREILTLGTAEPDFGVHPEQRASQWGAALAFVDRWLRGQVSDPCPKALHWRGVKDPAPPDRVQVFCGRTANEFFYRRPHVVSASIVSN